MKQRIFSFLTKLALTVPILFYGLPSMAQNNSTFWQNVRFGGSLGLGFGSGYTDVTLAPSALYEVNEYFGVGIGLQGTYVNQKNYYTSFIYGGSIISVVNPIPQIQLSAEVEQLRVNLDIDERWNYLRGNDRDFWNTALFFGAGYRAQNVTVGLRYNILHKDRDMVYSNALMPFVRIYF